MLDHLPPRTHLVIATRADPPLPLARLRARGQLTEVRAPDLAPESHRRACSWFERQGLPADAADHALAAHDHALAARLIEQVSSTLLWQRGELATLLRWLERLPRDATRPRPRLSLDLAVAPEWAAGRRRAAAPGCRARAGHPGHR